MQINIFEIKRKIFHMLAGFFLIFFLDLGIINLNLLIVVLVIGLVLVFVYKKFGSKIIGFFMNHFERKEEKFPGRGAITFLVGSILALFLFEKNVAYAAITILAVGDAVSSLFGMHFGKIKSPVNDKKLIEGTFVAIILAGFAASIFVPYQQAFIGAFAGMIIEAIEIKITKDTNLDDNLTIPLVAGLFITLLRIYF
jgi:dolichol kinase